VAKRKEKEDWVMKCCNEKGKGRLGDEVWQRERKKEDWVRKCGKEKGKRRLGDGV
jgi:hypothetical protein